MITLKKTIAGRVGSRKKLYEADMRYTPEEINKFTAEATKDIENLKKIFIAFKSKVENLSIADMLKSPDEVKSMYEKLKTADDYARQQYDYYFTIVEPYDYTNKDAKELDRLVSKIDDLQQNLRYVYDAVYNMIDAAKDFNKFNQVEDEES